MQLVEDADEHGLGDDPAALDIVPAVHQHFWFDDRDQPLFLGNGRVARQSMRIRVDAVGRRETVVDLDHRAPFREARTDRPVLRTAFAQVVQTFGDRFFGREGQGFRSLVDLDARDDPRGVQDIDERPSVRGALAKRFVEQNDTGYVRFGAGCGEQKFAIVAAVLLVARDADAVEAPLDGP